MESEEFRDLAVNNRAELERIKTGAMSSSLYNEDLAPTGPEQRTWTTYNIAALWIGMAIVITTYALAAGLMAAGMNWWQALLTISLGNLIVLVPMLLNAHAGTKYGVPFPVFVRASFGVRGANFAAMARALVACGWFGIQTWLGGLALDALTTAVWGGWANVPGHQFIAFFVFWVIQVAIILAGVEGVKYFESLSAPLLIVGSIALLVWGFSAGGGVSEVFTNSAKLQQGHAPFWALFWPSLAANVGYWITLSLNIPDFTRYARTQRSQVLGQALGLPLTMTAFSFIGIAVTAATVVVFGEAIWDPVEVVTRVRKHPGTAHHRHDRHRAGPDLDEHGCECGLAVVRLLEPGAEVHLVSHGRHDHRTHRCSFVSLGPARERGRVHLHLARRLW